MVRCSIAESLEPRTTPSERPFSPINLHLDGAPLEARLLPAAEHLRGDGLVFAS
jgi:hypothetical protein